jgi:thioredoxin-like negative regulator of GroEL
VYPDERVVRFVTDHFIPVRIHVREQADEWKRIGGRYGVQWTPTVLVVDPSGEERHRLEGFLPLDDFLAQLQLGRAKAAFGQEQFEEAEKRFRAVVDTHPATESAAEAFYWTGVSRYKATNDATALAETARGFQQRYQNSSWAKKSSVWGS